MVTDISGEIEGSRVVITNPLAVRLSDGTAPIIEDELLLVDTTTTTNITYVCKATPGSATSGALWKIYILDETGTTMIKKYADGNINYDNVADNRASLSYS